MSLAITHKFQSRDFIEAGEMRETFKTIIKQDLSHLLPKIHVKTLIVWGNLDEELSVQHTKVFRSTIPNSQVRIVWGADHYPHLSKYNDFIKIVENFIC